MCVNNSSSTNGSSPARQSWLYFCPCVGGAQIFGASIFTYILFVLPLSSFVLHLGCRQWKRQRSSEAVMTSCDFFTCNMAAMELIGTFGGAVYVTCRPLPNLSVMADVGHTIMAFPWSGQMFLPVLTCADRYMAVVHPIAYLTMKQATRVRVRNVSIGFIWLQGFGGIAFTIMMKSYPQYSLIPGISLIVFSLIAVIFCSLPVLYVLLRPRPGEAGGGQPRVDPSKQRAFITIVVIMGVLFFRFGGTLVCYLVTFVPTVSCSLRCLVLNGVQLFSLPSSLALPLLFLHRRGKLAGCKHSAKTRGTPLA